MSAQLSPKLDWELANPLWSAALNPVINNPIVQGRQISNLVLAANTPIVINHGLGRMMMGWFVVDTNASATIWRTANMNPKTLTLEASANVTISIWVY